MEALLIKRRVLKGKITRIEKAWQAEVERQNSAAAHLFLQKLQVLSEELDMIHNDITVTCEEAEFTSHETEYDQLMSRLEKLSITMMVVGSSAQATSTAEIKPVTDVKLPRIELPSFDGRFDQWLSFHDLFVATVHRNAGLSGAQKLQYLKSSLKGEAAVLIQSIPVTDDNYTEAWEILRGRYHNEREIISSLIQKLFDQPCISKGSAIELRRLLDTTNECVRALKVLKEPVQHWDSILIHVLKSRLDPESRRYWELSQKDSTKPTFAEFTTCLDSRARALAAAQTTMVTFVSAHKQSSSPQAATSRKSTVSSLLGSVEPKCAICKNGHPLFRCPEFLSASPCERRNMVKSHKLCYNCLRAGHQSQECQSSHCKKCKHNHNTLLHLEDINNRPSEPTSGIEATEVISHFSQNGSQRLVLLSTAIILIKDVHGQFQPFRALLDSASQASFISEGCAQRLKLKRHSSHVTVSGIGATGHSNIRNGVNLTIRSPLDSTREIAAEVFILPKVTRDLPNFQCNPAGWTHIDGLTLADPHFSVPGAVDILLGADVHNDLMLSGVVHGPPGTPSAVRTIFGWTLLGPVSSSKGTSAITVHHCQIDTAITDLWELEQLPAVKPWTNEQLQCEEHFMATHVRDSTGRYMVRLPFKSTPDLGDSRRTAIQQFYKLEARLQRDQSLYNQYREFMDQYIRLGHMKLIPREELSKKEPTTYYMPHHAVIKNSTTTKLRVVFNASCVTTSGRSLNDELLVGPRTQEDLLNLLLRFRLYVVVLTADIEKMFRQIRIHPDDADFQRVLWRSDPQQPLQEYRLVTVTYGTACAPFLATRVLQQLARDESSNFPRAAKVLEQDFYMDDLITGANSSFEAKLLQAELLEICRKGGLVLRKWVSNEPTLLESLEPELREMHPHLLFEPENSVKSLGIGWQPGPDHLVFQVSLNTSMTTITKRGVLAITARIFDPLGLVSPVILRAKLLLQELWLQDLGWDEEIPEGLAGRWRSLIGEFVQLQEVQIPRCITHPEAVFLEIHGFSDASEKAYAAAVYLRSCTPMRVLSVQLIASKTRVAPKKSITLPRLELCGALLLSRLIKVIVTSLKTPISAIHAWSDSSIVLAWIAGEPHRWKCFVANRVAEIQQSLPEAQWHHVAGGDNPADTASRGASVSGLKEDHRWWHGPLWLTELDITCHAPESARIDESQLEPRKTSLVAAQANVDHSLLERYSSLSKLLRVTAYMFRFAHNCQLSTADRQKGALTCDEIDRALKIWIRSIQHEEFPTEIECLQKGKPLRNNNLLQLSPFLDEDGLLRVGGRLRHAQLSADNTHPFVLHHRNRLSQLLIHQEHLRQLHGGPQLVLAMLRQRFWILGARNAVRKHIHDCVVCVRQRAASAKQVMSDLPAPRVRPARPFANCGVDFAGPVLLRSKRGRGAKMSKAYISVFVCFVTHAIHLELVSSLSTNAFIATLKRFVSRRGICEQMFSDCGTNFVGADRELRKFVTSALRNNEDSELQNWLAEQNIKWNFNPPAAPHFGGHWEAGVKAVKCHLVRVVGNAQLTFEEMATVLAQIEACLNSRPLTSLSSDTDDFTALTPGHFLIGKALTAFPETNLLQVPSNRLSCWQHCQQLAQHFWDRWSREYLSTLQQRSKWHHRVRNLAVGDLVVLQEPNLPPTKWKLARITEAVAGPDGAVRVVKVKTADQHERYRPIVKLCPLP